MLFNEPKLLKFSAQQALDAMTECFSALQRAEIAEICVGHSVLPFFNKSFSALQRAEIAEIRV